MIVETNADALVGSGLLDSLPIIPISGVGLGDEVVALCRTVGEQLRVGLGQLVPADHPDQCSGPQR